LKPDIPTRPARAGRERPSRLRHRSSVPRYLVAQSCAAAAVGPIFALAAIATDTGQLGTLLADADLTSTIVFVIGSGITFFPLVLATAVGLLGSHEP
jgi:hypothetical protein